MIFSGLFAGLIYYTDPLFFPFYAQWGFDPDLGQDYATFLATVAGIGGVFIGLYYAAISAVGGTIYSRVPNDIRDLLAKERVGNAYMRFLSFTTFLAVTLLALNVVGLRSPIMGIPLLVVLSGISIISFVKLGARAFYFFDPTTLSTQIFRELNQTYNRIVAKSYRWLDTSFQSYSHKVAEANLDTLSTLADMTAREPHLNGRPFLILCKNSVYFLCGYERAKKRIPTKSLWYEKKYSHPDWYKSSGTITSMSHETGGQLSPELVSERNWVEERILPVIQQCLLTNIQRNRFGAAQELLSTINSYVKVLASENRTKDAVDLVESIFQQSSEEIYSKPSAPSEPENVYHIAIFDAICLAFIDVLLEHTKLTETLNRNSVDEKIGRIDWEKPESIYLSHSPVSVLQQLEWFQPRIEYEFICEGRKVSPDWYVSELICKAFCQSSLTSLEILLTKVPKLLIQWATSAYHSERYWLAACILSRVIEYLIKAGVHLPKVEGSWDSLSSHRRIPNLHWPESNFDELKRILSSNKKETNELMGKTAVILNTMNRPNELPDFGGKFLHSLGEAVFTSLVNNDLDEFSSLFRLYVIGSLQQFNNLRPKEILTTWQTEIEIKIAVAPLIDLMELSGYGLLFAELYSNAHISLVIKEVWDGYLDSAEDQNPEDTLTLLSGAVSLTEGVLELPHRSILRTAWSQNVAGKLRELERREVFSKGSYLYSETVVLHDSPLIRVFARDGYSSFFEGIDVFETFYLRDRPEEAAKNFRNRNIELQGALDRERQRYDEFLQQNPQSRTNLE